MSNKSILQSNNEALGNNNLDLQSLIDQANALPEAGGVVGLPALINEGTASDLFDGKELIDSNGNKIVGTFTIDEELTTQDDLITQIINQLEGKASYNTIYISSSEPTDDVGVNGDIYIVRGETT